MLNHKGTQIIHTNRLTLRPFTPEDAPAMFRNWANDPDVTKFLTWAPHGSVDVTNALLKSWCAEYNNPRPLQLGHRISGRTHRRHRRGVPEQTQ